MKLKIDNIDENKLFMFDAKGNQYEVALTKEDVAKFSFETGAAKKIDLSSREVQERLRAGFDKDSISQISTMPKQMIEHLSVPIEMEKRFIIESFKRVKIKNTKKSLPSIINEHTYWNVLTKELNKKHIYIDDIKWEASRLQNEPWKIIGSWSQSDKKNEIVFEYNNKEQLVLAKNKLAKELFSVIDEYNKPDLFKKVTNNFHVIKDVDELTPQIVDANTLEKQSVLVGETKMFQQSVFVQENNENPQVSSLDSAQLLNEVRENVVHNANTTSNANTTNTFAPATIPIKIDEQNIVKPPQNSSEDIDKNQTSKVDLSQIKPAIKKSKKNRPDFPSWDEILYGKEESE